MISSLEGNLLSLLPTMVEMEVGGVGYEVLIPLSTHDRLPQPPARVRLLTQLVVREDAHTLYGFATKDERDLFRLLINHVSGVGPKLALAILSGATIPHFRECVVNNDSAALSKIKGLGRKTAEKIILELRDKIGVSAVWEASAKPCSSTADSIANDAVLALIALGYKQSDALTAVRAAQRANPEVTLEELIRAALRLL